MVFVSRCQEKLQRLLWQKDQQLAQANGRLKTAGQRFGKLQRKLKELRKQGLQEWLKFQPFWQSEELVAAYDATNVRSGIPGVAWREPPADFWDRCVLDANDILCDPGARSRRFIDLSIADGCNFFIYSICSLFASIPFSIACPQAHDKLRAVSFPA